MKKPFLFFFFFNDTATTEIYTLSLHDALPISQASEAPPAAGSMPTRHSGIDGFMEGTRSEEHTSELQSQSNLVCRLLLEKKKKKHEVVIVRDAIPEPNSTERDTRTDRRRDNS